MSNETLRHIFRGVFSCGWVSERLNVVWHAGEPLVLPIEYYELALDEIKALTPLGVRVTHFFQTNGMFINDAWCDFFKANRFKIGVSIDGPQDLNDENRLTRSGKGTFLQVIKGIRALQRNSIEFHVISVLTRAALSRARDLYDFYEREGIANVCFNIEEIEGVNLSSSLSEVGTDAALEVFLREFWNLVIERKSVRYVREFHDILRNILSPMGAKVENTLVDPFGMVNVDWQGNFSTFSPELLGMKNSKYNDFILGNFAERTMNESLEGDVFKVLDRDILAGVENCRDTCEYFGVCGGGSPVNKLCENGSFKSAETMYCNLRVKLLSNLALEIIDNTAKQSELTPAASGGV